MKQGDQLWTREQLLLTINLYSKLTFGKMHKGNPDIIHLAGLMGRTPDAVAYKLVNFASLDPRLHQKGMDKTSKLDKVIFTEYMENWDDLFFETEQLLAEKQHTTVEKVYNIDLDNYKKSDGVEVQRMVKVRVDQHGFRAAVLTNFNNKCCITGIDMVDLLIASHIVPWSEASEHRLSPANGLALNSLHDKAFDKHLVTITEDLTIKISSKFFKHKEIQSIQENFIAYHDQQIHLPKKYYPNVDFLKRHNDSFVS